MSILRSGLNKIEKDEQKLKNRPVSQAVSPLTERVVNNNTNQKSLDMAGTQQSRQGVINQLAKDQEAVQQGALAQQQQTAEQQRAMQAQTVQQPMQPVEDQQPPPQSIQDFRSEGLELAQQEAKEKIDQWQEDMQSVAGFADRVPALVQEQLSAEAAEVGDFKINQDAINQIASQYATSTNANDVEDAKSTLNGFLNIMQGVSPVNADGEPIYTLDEDSEEMVDSEGNAMPSAMSYLIDNAADLNVDLDQIETFLTNTFETLNISAEQQRTMVTTALADGVVDPENLTIGFIKDNLGKEVKLEDQFGVDADTLQSVLGPDYEKMTVSEISDKIEEVYEENTLEISKLHKELKDPTISTGRKEEILREIQRRDASGITSMQAEAGRIKDRTAIADKLIIGGEIKSIQDVLNDDNLKSLSDNLLTEIEAAGNDQQKINEAVQNFIKEYPEYADLAKWVQDSYEDVTKRGKDVTSAIDLFKATAKESQEFIQNNEVFGGAGEGAKVILEALGFNIGDEDGGGLGILNNASNTEANAAYDVIKAWSEGNENKFNNLLENLQFLNAEDLEGIAGLIREKEVDENPEDGEPDVDAEGNIITRISNEDLIAALDMISSVDGMEDFKYLTGLNNQLDKLGDTPKFESIIGVVFPDGHPVKNMTESEIIGYVEDLKDLVDSKTVVGTRKVENEDGTITEENVYLGEEELAEIQAVFGTNIDTDGDGEIDNPATILNNIKEKIPENGGFNISNIFNDDTNKKQDLLNMLDDLDVASGLTTALNNTVTAEYNKFEKTKSDYEDWLSDPANNPASINEEVSLYLQNPNAPGSEEAAENLDKAFPYTSDSGKTPSEIIKGGGSKAAFMKESLGFLNDALANSSTKSISNIAKEIMNYSSYESSAWAPDTYQSLMPFLRGLGLDIQATGSKTISVVDEWGLGYEDKTISVVKQEDIENALTAWVESKETAKKNKQTELGYTPGDTNPMQDLYFDMNPAVAQALEG